MTPRVLGPGVRVGPEGSINPRLCCCCVREGRIDPGQGEGVARGSTCLLACLLLEYGCQQRRSGVVSIPRSYLWSGSAVVLVNDAAEDVTTSDNAASGSGDRTRDRLDEL